eukprot:jgi/Chlat1/4373/Chrsp29S00352
MVRRPGGASAPSLQRLGPVWAVGGAALVILVVMLAVNVVALRIRQVNGSRAAAAVAAAKEANWAVPRQSTGRPAFLNPQSDRTSMEVCRRHWARGLDEKVAGKLRNMTIFFALNLHNNDMVAGHLFSELTRLLALLDMKNIFVSVYESGSQDMTTTWLSLFDTTLTLMGAPHKVVMSSTDVRGSKTRIEFLADMRNKAMQPLYEGERHKYERVLFLNDVFVCAEDAMLLLLHDAHIASGFDVNFMDWGRRRIQFYDNWVARDINGEYMGLVPPFAHVKSNQELFEKALPFPVHCTWNGMVNLDASIFYDKGIRFRTRRWRGECAESECWHFCNDVWGAFGTARIVIDPRVYMSYNGQTFQALDMARQKKVPNGAPFDVGIRPNPFQEPMVLEGWLINDTLRHIDFPIPPPLLNKCCPMQDDRDDASWDLCYWEKSVGPGSVYHEDPAVGAPTCDAGAQPAASGASHVFIAVTLVDGEEVSVTLAQELEVLVAKHAGRVLVSILAVGGGTEWHAWRSMLMALFINLRVLHEHHWTPSLQASGKSAHWDALSRWKQHSQLSSVPAAVVGSQPFCAKNVLTALSASSARQACSEELLRQTPGNGFVMCNG